MPGTVLAPSVPGTRLAASWLNRFVTAVQELQGGAGAVRPRFHVTTDNGFTTTANQPLPYDLVRYDHHGGWDMANRWYTVPLSGLWLLHVNWVTTTIGHVSRQAIESVGGAPYAYAQGTSGGHASVVRPLVAGNQICVRERSSNNIALTSQPYFAGTYLGPT